MMKLIPDLPDNIIGIIASGHISATDYETVLIPTIESAIQKYGKIRVLYQLEDNFTGFSTAAMWDDMKLGLGHLKAWERIAIVTDVGWVSHATSMFKFIIPCPIQVFEINQFTQAKEWLIA